MRSAVKPVDAIRLIAETADAIAAAKRRKAAADPATKDALQAAVDTARDLGVSWQSIGNAVGMRRGNAYQRFRPRPLAKGASPASSFSSMA